jgi:hypothetical protein
MQSACPLSQLRTTNMCVDCVRWCAPLPPLTGRAFLLLLRIPTRFPCAQARPLQTAIRTCRGGSHRDVGARRLWPRQARIPHRHGGKQARTHKVPVNAGRARCVRCGPGMVPPHLSLTRIRHVSVSPPLMPRATQVRGPDQIKRQEPFCPAAFWN